MMLFLQEWSTSALISVSLIPFLLFVIIISIHRLSFSRYAKFPGPKLAGLSYGYMFYYDYISGDGQYYKKIQQLHEEYQSSIIRISPHELHVNDPDFYEILFAGPHAKRDKPPTWSHAFSNINSVFGTISDESHRVRRNAIASSFSPASMRKLEPTIQGNIQRLITVLRSYQSNGQPVPMRPAFSALTSDIISEYCFGENENYVEAPGFNDMVLTATDTLVENMHVTVQFQWLPKLLDMLPDRLTEAMMGPGLAKFNELKHHSIAKIKNAMNTVGDYRDVEHKTIFHSLLESKTLPPQDKTVGRLWQEGQLLLAAGTATTAATLYSAIVYLLLDEKRLLVLLGELEEAMPNINRPLPRVALEKLPYLNAVVQETLRLVSGVSYRLARSAPSEALQLGKWTIPPNTAVSMHSPLIHHSPILYPEPWSFIPERWLPSSYPPGLPTCPEHIPRANPKYLIPFSRGSRSCIGTSLANAEVFMTLANVLRTFARLEKNSEGSTEVKGMRLWETDRRDVDLKRDLGFAFPEKGRGNVRILLE